MGKVYSRFIQLRLGIVSIGETRICESSKISIWVLTVPCSGRWGLNLHENKCRWEGVDDAYYVLIYTHGSEEPGVKLFHGNWYCIEESYGIILFRYSCNSFLRYSRNKAPKWDSTRSCCKKTICSKFEYIWKHTTSKKYLRKNYGKALSGEDRKWYLINYWAHWGINIMMNERRQKRRPAGKA